MRLTDLEGKRVSIQWINVAEVTICEVLDVDLKSGWIRVEREDDQKIAWGALTSIRGILEDPV